MTHLIKEHAVAPINYRRGFSIHLLTFLLVIPAVWLIWLLTDTSYPWPIWNTGAWATGVLFYYLGVFVFRNNKRNQ